MGLALLLLALAAAAPMPAMAAGDDDSGEGEGEEDDSLSRFRTPFDVLAEQAIGTTSVPVEFNWRRSKVHLAATGNHYFELNNFNSLRAGALARFPSSRTVLEVGASYAFVWDSPSSQLLALTPYRQPGRPPRIELDVNLGYPLAEGVVTTFPRAFPAVQMVFTAYGGFRYLLYPNGFSEMTVREIGSALLSPTMTRVERNNLDDARLDAMQIDSARYGAMLGVGNELYFRQGLFVAPRLMMGVPVLAPITGSELWFWADLSISVGVAL